MQRIILLHFIVWAPAFSAIAQNSPSCNVQQYSTENGMPSNGVKGLQFDEKTGFLWIATEAGIVRFNGVDFVTYTSQNMPSIASERMLFITRNNSGRILVCDSYGNIFTVNKSNPHLWWKPAQKPDPYFDNYFLFSVSDSFFKAQLSNKTLNTLSSITSRTAPISDTSCFILTGGILYYYSISMKKPALLPFEKNQFNILFKIGSQCFLQDNYKNYFLINPSGFDLFPVGLNEDSNNPFASSHNGIQFWEMGMKTPIIINGTEVFEFNFDGKNINARHLFSGIPTDAFIRSVHYSEKNNQLFIGTDSRGIIVINSNRVNPHKRKFVLANRRNAYYSQIELANGAVLTNEGDIIGDSTANKNLPIKGPFAFNTSMTSDSVLWYSGPNPGLPDCLHSFDYKSGITKTYSWLPPTTLVSELNGIRYFVNGQGVGTLDQDTSKLVYKYPGQNFGVGLYDFIPINNNHFLIASCKGILRYDVNNGKVDSVYSQKNVCFRSLLKYGEYVFIGSYGGGFFVMKNGVIKSMPLDKNRFLLYAHCFVPDKNGYCWISTNRGLFKASMKDLISAYEKNESRIYYHFIGKNDGMDITEMNGGCTPCALVMKNSTISFPTMDGLLWVNPEKANLLLPEGNIYIDEFRAGHAFFDPDSLSEKSLQPNQRDISIKLGYSSWCNKENIYLDYRLNNKNWIPVDIESGAIISFNNLPPGKYHLKIRKLNGFGINNYSYKDLDFTIKTPWNRQWWFYLLLIAVLWGLVSVYLRFRTRQYQIRQRNLEQQVANKTRELKQQNEILEKNNTIKSRLISIISHDIITPLKFLTVAGNNLIEKKNIMTEDLQQETIREMTNTSQELQLLSTNILNWIKYQNENRLMARETFNVHEMVSQVLGLLSSLAKQKKLVLENNVPESLEVYQYYEPLKILVYNLLTNAIQFTEKGNISVEASDNHQSMKLSVSDEGVGMNREQIQRILAEQVVITSANVDNKKGHGLGYLIIKDLVKTMNATIDIDSERGKGTRVTITIPVVNEKNRELK